MHHYAIEISVDHLVDLPSLRTECLLVDRFQDVVSRSASALHGILVRYAQHQHDRNI